MEETQWEQGALDSLALLAELGEGRPGKEGLLLKGHKKLGGRGSQGSGRGDA